MSRTKISVLNAQHSEQIFTFSFKAMFNNSTDEKNVAASTLRSDLIIAIIGATNCQ